MAYPIRLLRWIFHTEKIIFSILFFYAFEADAFLFIRGLEYAKGARPVSEAPLWDKRKLVFRLNPNQRAFQGSIDPLTGQPDLTEAVWIESVQTAIDAWAEACQADIEVSLSGTESRLNTVNDLVNTIVWDNRTTGEGNFFGAGTDILASATTSLVGDQFLDCDIVVNGNSGGLLGASGQGDRYDLVSVLAHEIGHCLGLDHPIEPPTYDSANQVLRDSTLVQSSVYGPGDIRRRSINQDDKDAMQCIYERGNGFRRSSVCSSYHGTGGGAAISGTVTGGPSAENPSPVCTTPFEGNTLSANFSETAGCIPVAQANVKRTGAHRSPASTQPVSGERFWIWVLFGAIAWKIFRRWRFARS